MGCIFSKSTISAYVDGELTGVEMLRARAHIRECPQCARAAEEMRAVKQALLSLRTVSPPDGLADRLCDAIAQAAPVSPLARWIERLREAFSPRRRVRVVWTVAAAAACMLFAVLLTGIHNESALVSSEPLNQYTVQHELVDLADYKSSPFRDYSEWAYTAGNNAARFAMYQTPGEREGESEAGR
jgi:anti-sigma factor RsiW